jgi:hypothetical protein
MMDVQHAGAPRSLTHIFPQDTHPFPRAIIRSRWASEIENPGVDVYVIENDDGQIAGFAARLRVFDQNRRARRFYEKHGWRPTDRTRRTSFRQLVLHAPAPIVAEAMGIHHTNAARQAINVGSTWNRYVPGDHTRSE